MKLYLVYPFPCLSVWVVEGQLGGEVSLSGWPDWRIIVGRQLGANLVGPTWRFLCQPGKQSNPSQANPLHPSPTHPPHPNPPQPQPTPIQPNRLVDQDGHGEFDLQHNILMSVWTICQVARLNYSRGWQVVYFAIFRQVDFDYPVYEDISGWASLGVS